MIFSGKTLLITGGSRGIGKKICFEFAKRGCNIIFTYVRSSSESKKIESELLKFGVNVISKKLNLNSNDDIKKFVENIKNLDIKIDFLINNAASGVMTPAGGVVTADMVILATAFLTPLFTVCF